LNLFACFLNGEKPNIAALN